MERINPEFEIRLIDKSYMKYILPATLSLFFTQVAPIVDALCISLGLGEEALSAITVVSPIYYFFNVIALLTGVGAGVSIAKEGGAGHRDRTGKIFTRALMLAVILSIVVSILGLIFMDPLLRVLSATPENMTYSKNYLRVMLIGFVFYVLNMGGAYVLTDDNNPNLAMAGGIVASVINIIIDVVGIFVLKWGIWIAAFGTVFGMFCSCLVYMIHFRRKERLCRIDFSPWTADDPRMWDVFRPGVPLALMNLLLVVQMVVTNMVLEDGAGTAGLSSAAVIENLELITTIITAGITESVMPLAAAYFGEGNKSCVLLVKRTALRLGLGIMVPLVSFFVIWPQAYIGLYGIKSQLALETLPTSIRIVAAGYLLMVVSEVFQNYLTSVEREKIANISFFVQSIVQIIAMLVLARWTQIYAPWLAFFLGLALQLLYLLVFGDVLEGCFKFCQEKTLLMTGGHANAEVVKDWLASAASVLSEDQANILDRDMLSPFAGNLPEGKSPMSSFTIFTAEDGNKVAVLRYDSKTDYLGEEDEEDSPQEIRGEAATGNDLMRDIGPAEANGSVIALEPSAANDLVETQEQAAVNGPDPVCKRSEFNTMRRWMISFS